MSADERELAARLEAAVAGREGPELVEAVRVLAEGLDEDGSSSSARVNRAASTTG